MSHIFDAKKFKKLESPERYKALPVDLVLDILSLKKTMHIADVGCGIGYFTFPFAKSSGHVYGIDLSSVMIDELTKRNQETNVTPLLGNFNTLIEDASLDLFFTSTVIHELPDLNTFTLEAISKLKSGGRIAYLDFEKKAMEFGPPIEKRIASSTVASMFSSMQLKSVVTYPVKDAFYIVIGEK